ncbi:protein jag [Amnibacterium kyonggiense]|uniref:SpoIIIJ-associated protein n=1 Tax=Amnibacterium kyonggiense TaxID=595671 RepID=A0A4V3EB04_9MICO|nr:R3H domain-containing nucleic acid-binding protein [Amnibacterium kyonggiense]TDS79834.1 spoIIIJ-associated protein [Amnibacterium kyonggiense]
MTVREPEEGAVAPVEDDVVGLQAALDGARRASEEPGGEDVGDIAADYIEELLDIADLDGDIEIEDEGGRTTLKVTGGDLRLLSDADTVGALQELTRLAVQTRTGGFARLTLDIGGSRDQRARELAALVESAVAAIGDGAAGVPLAPMSSYERKLVHDLAAERGLQSHSEGEGGDRHIVLTPA